jgi:hypothetical protein
MIILIKINIPITEYYHCDLNNPAEKLQRTTLYDGRHNNLIERILPFLNKGSSQTTTTVTETFKKNPRNT